MLLSYYFWNQSDLSLSEHHFAQSAGGTLQLNSISVWAFTKKLVTYIEQDGREMSDWEVPFVGFTACGCEVCDGSNPPLFCAGRLGSCLRRSRTTSAPWSATRKGKTSAEVTLTVQCLVDVISVATAGTKYTSKWGNLITIAVISVAWYFTNEGEHTIIYKVNKNVYMKT